MSRTQINEFLSEFVIGGYPEGFLDRYEPMECLAHNPACETMLVREMRSGACFVAKCYHDKSLLSEENESILLGRLHHPGLPGFAAKFQNDAMLCVVREYAEGVPLDAWRLEKDRSREEVVSAVRQLCDILSYLHAQKPPVIHRDLKPQNIIVGKNGRVKLIDFGIARAYEEGAKADTVCFGTKEFAPPEQYGFSQTDARADIYSLGVVLRFLLTGETDAEAAGYRMPGGRWRRVVAKCTAFSPDRRYASAARVKRALAGAARGAKRAVLPTAAVAAAALLAAGFAVGRYTDFLKGSPHPGAAVAFKEPLVERAVRQSLGMGPEGALTREGLAGVTELYIWSDSVAAGPEEYYALGADWTDNKVYGDIASLEDVALLPNLRVLMAANQRITDLSPLSGLKGLRRLNLDRNPVWDISALSGLDGLEFIGLNETDVSALSPLASCPALRELVLDSVPCADFSFLSSLGDIEFLHVANILPERVLPFLRGKSVRQLRLGFVALPSLEGLQGIRSLQALYLDEVRLGSLAGAGGLAFLTELRLTGARLDDLSPLLSLRYLERVEVDGGLRSAAEALAGKAGFEIVYR